MKPQVENYELVNKESIRAGDTILHNGKLRTITKEFIKYNSTMGVTLFGDSYNLGYKKVVRVINNTVDAHISDGSKTNYYQIPSIKGYVDVDDIAEHLNLHGFLFNVLKSVFGCGIESKTGNSRHSGTSQLRDANKMVHYSLKYRDMIKNNQLKEK